MGTATDRGNSKKTVTMTQVFRGLLDILHQNQSDLHQKLNAHIRSFDRKLHEDDLDLSVVGFWSLVLELVFNCYTQTVLAVGTTLILILALLTYPVRFFGSMFAGSLWRQPRALTAEELHMYHTQQQLFNEQVGIVSKAPVTEETRKEPKIEDDDKVVRRVVYEEAKVKK